MSIKKSDLLIGGQMRPPTSGRYYPLYSPIDGTLVAEVADASRADVDRAAVAAREAFYAEWKFCGIERKRALFAQLKEVLYAMADELAVAKVQPQGGPDIPPLVERVEHYVELGKAQGDLLFGGARPPGAEYAKGCYFEPTAFAFADQASPVCRDEIFGPVVSVLTFDSDDEALALANDTDYGLLVSLWTLDPERQRYFVRRLEVGVVAINSTSMLSHRTPWGGFKQSGLGRRYGELGLEPFFEYKTVWT